MNFERPVLDCIEHRSDLQSSPKKSSVIFQHEYCIHFSKFRVFQNLPQQWLPCLLSNLMKFCQNFATLFRNCINIITSKYLHSKLLCLSSIYIFRNYTKYRAQFPEISEIAEITHFQKMNVSFAS